MTLTDHVAKFLLDSHKLAAKQTGRTVKDIYEETKSSSTHEHPTTERLFITYNIKVGDVLEAKDPFTLMILLGGVVIGPNDKLVVYKVSYPQKDLVLPKSMAESNSTDVLKVIVLLYTSFSVQDMDLSDIKACLCLTNNHSVVNLLENCYWITNIADRLD